jgi:hypothetical protein
VKRILLPLLASMVLLAWGCASAPAGERSRSDGQVITAEAIERSRHATVLDLIQAERPNWLRTRGGGTLRTTEVTDARTGDRVDVMDLPPLAVYLDGARYGTLADLQGMRPAQVSRLEFLSAAQATGRFGTNHVNGAILVTTGR